MIEQLCLPAARRVVAPQSIFISITARRDLQDHSLGILLWLSLRPLALRANRAFQATSRAGRMWAHRATRRVEVRSGCAISGGFVTRCYLPMTELRPLGTGRFAAEILSPSYKLNPQSFLSIYQPAHLDIALQDRDAIHI